MEMEFKDYRHGIHWADYEKYGCPQCGSDYSHSTIRSGNEVPATCGECGAKFVILPDYQNTSTFKFGDEKYEAHVINHPRVGTPKHKFKAPDIRPEGEGEFWRPRGIGYDLSGFVKSKEAGERVVDMFRKALGREPKTWLDFREYEPTWIQVKVQGEEADLHKLYSLTYETGIITQSIVDSVVKV